MSDHIQEMNLLVLDSFEKDFGIDVSEARSLTGDALGDWIDNAQTAYITDSIKERDSQKMANTDSFLGSLDKEKWLNGLETEFGIDVSEARSLSGDDLEEWFYQFEDKYVNEYLSEKKSSDLESTESNQDDFQDTMTPEQAEAYYNSEEYFDREWSEYEESENYGKW
jgi:glutamate synthase domain-containing protein 3